MRPKRAAPGAEPQLRRVVRFTSAPSDSMTSTSTKLLTRRYTERALAAKDSVAVDHPALIRGTCHWGAEESPGEAGELGLMPRMPITASSRR